MDDAPFSLHKHITLMRHDQIFEWTILALNHVPLIGPLYGNYMNLYAIYPGAIQEDEEASPWLVLLQTFRIAFRSFSEMFRYESQRGLRGLHPRTRP